MKADKLYSNVRGTFDFDVSSALSFRQIEDKARKIFSNFGYKELILPLLEEKGLFIKGVGADTDIGQRQIFKIEDKDIVLRPEGTAQVIRYYLQNSLHKRSEFCKFFYIGPMFRGERPQKGRLRQFHHLGLEAIGSNNFYLDAEVIILCLKLLEKIGVKEKELKINTLGCKDDKEKFSKHLRQALRSREDELCDDCKNRLDRNPLRVVDCKKRECKEIVKSANLKQTHLCKSCKQEFKDLLTLLDDLDIKYTHDPCLVRGLDYYTNTVFEVVSSRLGAQDAIGAGGRYNNLIKSLGGPDVPAIGFALGLERIQLVLQQVEKKQKLDVFVAVLEDFLAKPGFSILKDLRESDLSCDFDYCGKSLKAQLRTASKYGARFVVIVGPDEYEDESVILKDMEKGFQEKVKINKLNDIILSILID